MSSQAKFSQAESRIVVSLAFLFVTLQERIDEKVNISRHLCLLLRYGSRFIVKYTKAAKVVIVQQSAALRARFTIFTSRASQFRARPFLSRCGFAVYTTSKPYRFKTRPCKQCMPKCDIQLSRFLNKHVTISDTISVLATIICFFCESRAVHFLQTNFM